jgi:hypothetical protein
MLKKVLRIGRYTIALMQRRCKLDKLIYSMMACLYFAAMMGLDKSVVNCLAAMAYTVLALKIR